MNRQEFEGLSLEEQLAYVNERPKMKVKEIAEEIDMPPSSLSNLFSDKGYKRVSGLYIKKTEAHSEEFQPIKTSEKDLQELLQDKKLLNLLKAQQHQPQSQIDYSVLDCYQGNKKAVNLELPEDQIKEMNAFLKKTGLKKQMFISLAIYQLMQKYA